MVAPLAHIAEPLRTLAVPIDTLTLDPANARTHDEKNLDAIKGSLTRFGQRLPIVVQKQGLIVRAGNGRVMAARALGWTHIAAVVVDESEVEATAFAIADNRSAELAEWDDESLAKLLQSLPEDAFAATGFSTDDLSELLESLTSRIIEQDDVPEPLPEPVSRRGDIWVMDHHMLGCGDSTNPQEVGRVLDGERPVLILTDPPYGVEYVGKTADALTIQNDGVDGLEDLLRGSLTVALEASLPGAVWYVAAPAGPQFAIFGRVLGELGVWRQTLAWVKDSMVLGHSDYHYRHEAIFYGWSPGAPHRAPPDRTRTSVLEFERPKASREHPTMKPVALWAELIQNSTPSCDALVYDPFCGSGTTLIACEQTGRCCNAMELEPRYVDVAVMRWQALTGREARLQDHGSPGPWRTFADVAAERAAQRTAANESAPASAGAEEEGDLL